MTGASPRAAVLTVSDGAFAGTRPDGSGAAVESRLKQAGYAVGLHEVVPDEAGEVAAALRRLAGAADLVVTTGGTGFGPRDVTPEATRAVIQREAPGLAEAMRAAGTRHTPMASLSRGVAGTIDRALVINLPGSPKGAIESLEAVLPVLGHALQLLAGNTEHAAAPAAPPPGTDVEDELRRRVERGEDVVLALAVRVEGSPPCEVGQKLLVGPGGPLAGTLGCAEFDSAAVADTAALLAGGEPGTRVYTHDLGSVEVYVEPHRRAPQLMVIGATSVALWLLRWGRDLGYRTALVEAREGRVTPELQAAAGRVASGPESLLAPGEEVFAVHTDHDAPLVAEHLAAVIRARPRFVGVMGSARHAAPHLQALRALGVSAADVGSIRSPVGLDLGARTPQGIALSILAGMSASGAGRDGGWLDRRTVDQ